MYSNAQHYCLRWNNHRSNLLTVFDELLQNEAFTDVTLVCDGGSPIKCHRMVLAACSPYFQNLFTDLPCKHPVVVLKDVRYSDIKAILEYMYRGEVNVGQNQLADLLRVAEALKVKGLVEEKRASESSNSDVMRPDSDQPSPTGVSTSSTSNNQSTVHSSSAESPPHSTNNGFVAYKNPYNLYNKKPSSSSTTYCAESQSSPRMNIPMWPMPGMPMPPASHSPTEHSSSSANPNSANTAVAAAAAAAMLGSCYQGSNSDMNPLKRKKLSSLLMSRDTPILRTVLGQADSSQPVSLVCHSDESPGNVNSNGVEEAAGKHIKTEPSEGAQSPFTDISMEYDDKSKMSMNTSYASGISGIATYVPSNAKPEWKRYKQYTRTEIMSAIEAVRNGMSALQAARKYGVPSRTLYDKVKKLGITTSRPFKRGSNGSNLGFPYGISGTSSPFGMDSADEHSINNNSSLLEASSILQHALDGRDDKETLAAMMAAAAAHAAVSGRNTSPNNNSSARTTSPLPGNLKYMRMNSLPPSPVVGSDPNHSETNGSGSSTDRDHDDHDPEHDDHEDHDPDEHDQVEDLSVARKQVIMPPINMSSIMKKEEMLKETLMEEMRREVSVDNAE